MQADGNSNEPVPASSRARQDRGPWLAGTWRMASQAFWAGRNRLEPTAAGRVWKQLSELRVVNSSLEFAAVFTLGFIPFLMVLSVALSPDLPRAIIIRGGFSGKAARDVAMLFGHSRTAPASLSVLSFALAVVGGAAISQMLQAWYATIFQAEIHRWKAMARRAEWLAGVSGFVVLQVVIGRTIQPLSGHIAAAGMQFLLAVAFWWWSLHCLLCGQIPWRRLFLAGLATALCYTGLLLYVVFVMSSSVVSNEATYGPIGAVITLLTAEIGLAVTLQLGAAIGATIKPGKNPHNRRPNKSPTSANQKTPGIAQQASPPHTPPPTRGYQPRRSYSRGMAA